MFYSHEVLTSRKYGVATVWLVATLGSKSASKKINRKAIQDVDVPKACQTIIDPVAPMALRLQGNLLYGVSRVYVQQCDYVLSDAQNTYNAMHLMLRALGDAALDPQAGKARPEQLVLPDDPSFLPEFAMPPPDLLAELNLGLFPPMPRISGDSQSLTPLNNQYEPSTPARAGGLILPTSSSVGPDAFILPGNGPSSIGGPPIYEDDELIDAPDFTFDENGEFVDLTEAKLPHGTPAAPGGSNMQSDAGASARVRQEHEEGLRGGIQRLGEQMEFDLPLLGDDLPDGEAFPTNPQDQSEEVIESTDTIVAPNRRRQRAPRVIPIDTTQELRNRDIADWNTNYLANMEEASKAKINYKKARRAKENAEYWMWNVGIGGIAARSRSMNDPSPFDRFLGENLYDLYAGGKRRGGARKRDRDSGIDEATQEEARRVRRRAEEAEVEGQAGRAENDEDMLDIGGEDVEMPREERAALEIEEQQRFSDMPWNLSASVRGSSAIPRSGRVGSAPPSRMVSESPLHRHSKHTLDSLLHFEDGNGDILNLNSDDYLGFAGPGPSSDMPDALLALPKPDSRIRSALSAERGNFLDFVANAIEEKHAHPRVYEDDESVVSDKDNDGDKVSFEALFPPENNNRVVAAQALMMTLELGSRGLIDVRQEEHFEEIELKITEKGRVAKEGVQRYDDYDGGENEEDEGEIGGDGVVGREDDGGVDDGEDVDEDEMLDD